MQVETTEYPPFSYLLTPEPFSDPGFSENYLSQTLPCGRFFHHTRDIAISLAHDDKSGSYVFVAGLLIDLNRDTISNNEISTNLIRELSSSIDSFYDYIDKIAGRYIIIFRVNKHTSPSVINDACGMLKINYDTSAFVLSSNIFLINKNLGGKKAFRSEFLNSRSLWKMGSLGNLQPFEDVKIVTPNHQLDLETLTISRFYPRRPIPTDENIEDVSQQIVDLCKRQNVLLASKFSLFHSLTAGIDSRFSLAISRNTKSLDHYFTYLFAEDQLVDALVADDIAKTLSLNHYIIIGQDLAQKYTSFKSPTITASSDPHLLLTIEFWNWYRHGTKNVVAYKNCLLPGVPHTSTPLHIRSNLYEIGRAFWGAKRGECHNQRKILGMSRKDWSKEASPIFDRFFEETDINDRSVHGIDLLDIFYWEHRCATWVGEILQGTDFAFNTHSYVNCRKIIELFLSVPFDAKVDHSIFSHTIDQLLPELRTIPINPDKYSSDQLRRSTPPVQGQFNDPRDVHVWKKFSFIRSIEHSFRDFRYRLARRIGRKK